ncbi:hypothetical protein D1007_06935 [Hordeum vulgare]|nr:hypothetical protein D1007_06935 [Hordeum vulgare]
MPGLHTAMGALSATYGRGVVRSTRCAHRPAHMCSDARTPIGARGFLCIRSKLEDDQDRADVVIAEGRKEAAKTKAPCESALAKAGTTAKSFEKEEANLKALQDEWAAQAQQLQLREDDLKVHEAKLAGRDSELAKVAAEQAIEHMRLEVHQCRVTRAEEAYAKHVSEANAKLDARENDIQADNDAKSVDNRITFSSLELTTHKALNSLCRERFEAPLASHDTGYAELSSKIMEELEDTTQKVGDILEEECRDLFSLAATCVFSHLLLYDSGFNFGEAICPIPKESHGDLAEAIESHVSALLG